MNWDTILQGAFVSDHNHYDQHDDAMTGGDAHNQQLISAYLDGELTSDERQQVEQFLATNAEYRRLLDDLRALMDGLQELPRLSLDEGFVSRVIEQTRQSVQMSADSQKPEEVSQELLSAYLDGELSPDDASYVQRQLETDIQSQQYVQQLRALDRELRALPRHTLDNDFAARVLRRAERTMLIPVESQPHVADGSELVVTLAERSATDESRSSWRGFVWSAAVVAAALVLTFVLRNEPRTESLDVAGIPLDTPGTNVDIQQPGVPTPSSEDVPEPGHPGTEVKPPSRRAPDGDWQLVMAMQENARQRLILIYEVSVTSFGVEQGAFAGLLNRHNIGFRDTVPVGDQEQTALLGRRFLEGVELATPGKTGMDQIRLYLVSCTGNEADALYQDLAGSPPGFASFSLNLTSGEAGGGVLNRVCDTSKISERSNEAVRLAASFVMMSETARNLGVFGKIQWIDPELMTPPQSAEDKSTKPRAGHEDAETPTDPGNFQCELLFVVRNLQPAPGN